MFKNAYNLKIEFINFNNLIYQMLLIYYVFGEKFNTELTMHTL